jgi:hypothetical protein
MKLLMRVGYSMATQLNWRFAWNEAGKLRGWKDWYRRKLSSEPPAADPDADGTTMPTSPTIKTGMAIF